MESVDTDFAKMDFKELLHGGIPSSPGSAKKDLSNLKSLHVPIRPVSFNKIHADRATKMFPLVKNEDMEMPPLKREATFTWKSDSSTALRDAIKNMKNIQKAEDILQMENRLVEKIDNQKPGVEVGYINSAIYRETCDEDVFVREMSLCSTSSSCSTSSDLDGDCKEEDEEPDMTAEVLKLLREQEEAERAAAHKAWMEKKKIEQKIKLEKEKKLKLQQEQLEKEKQDKVKAIANENFKKWVNRKNSESKISKLVTTLKKTNGCKEEDSKKLKRITEAKIHRSVWEQKKAEEESRLKILKKREEERLAQLKLEREKQAAESFNSWLSTAHTKPKPVPLNKGIKSFDLPKIGWVNPTPWDAGIEIAYDSD